MPNHIPIRSAKLFAKELGLRQVIIAAWDGELTHVVTYGVTAEDCDQAAMGGERMKAAMGWPETTNALPSRVKQLKARAEAAEKERDEAREALRPFADTAEQLDKKLPLARSGRVTFIHPLEGILPELYGKTDRECPIWPLPDKLSILDAWRYHDPLAASEHIGFQMRHLRRARAVLSPKETR